MVSLKKRDVQRVILASECTSINNTETGTNTRPHSDTTLNVPSDELLFWLNQNQSSDINNTSCWMHQVWPSGVSLMENNSLLTVWGNPSDSASAVYL